ncbi:sugar ABC transporter substrate-binding protein [Nocardiopsis sp. TSRI0078]|uniref:ABC transporter substrate-binding protein n=1 Tax=unclassified Nocardiopsis TaxID=2649073 RepID=UPI00093EBD43|nr:ABC transporter substrate-binding protein [Nocardiopsis sp. TSRI0078]OKI23509.1 sugar ABC transporter substrate-binding protein [Nocardiopsis sp. TSRI0078]
MHHRPVGPPGLRRRTLLRGLAGAGTLLALPGLAGCGAGGRGDPNTVTMASNRANPAQREAVGESVGNFEAASGLAVEVNTFQSTAFQESINNYLQGTPDDVIGWFAGYRMRFFAERGLVSDVSEVWDRHFKDAFTDQVRDLCTADDGKQYMVPDSTAPWAVFHRRSLFEQNGYEVPATREEFVELCGRMRGDGLDPLASGLREGWPAMGMFDHLNLRLNGPEFHLELLNGDHSWDSPEVRSVFGAWAELLPHHQPDPLGRGINEAQTALVRREAGMMLCGMFITHSFPEEDLDDLDCFTFPEFDPAIGADTVEAPIDGFMLSGDPRNPEGARELVGHMGTLESQEIYTAIDPQALPVHTEADTSGFSALDAKVNDMVAGAGALTQYMDRDTRPDFASVVMIPALQRFVRQPDDIADLTATIQRQKASIFGH